MQLQFGTGLLATLGTNYFLRKPAKNLRRLAGEHHRKQRKMLNPVFSLANMRKLLPVIQPIANKLLDGIKADLPENGGTSSISTAVCSRART